MTFFVLDFIYFYRQGKEKERERNINVWLSLAWPPLWTWPATQACALTGNRTSNPLVRRPAFNSLSYTSQGCIRILNHINQDGYISQEEFISKKRKLHSRENTILSKLLNILSKDLDEIKAPVVRSPHGTKFG